LRAHGWWLRQRQVEQSDPLAAAAPAADGEDPLVLIEVESLDHHTCAEQLGLERQHEVFFEHREEPHALLGLAVGVQRGLCDEFV